MTEDCVHNCQILRSKDTINRSVWSSDSYTGRSNSNELSLTGFRTLDGDTGEFNGITSTVFQSKATNILLTILQ